MAPSTGKCVRSLRFAGRAERRRILRWSPCWSGSELSSWRSSYQPRPRGRLRRKVSPQHFGLKGDDRIRTPGEVAPAGDRTRPYSGRGYRLMGPRLVRASSEECSPRRTLLPAGPAGLTPRLRGGSWLDHSERAGPRATPPSRRRLGIVDGRWRRLPTWQRFRMADHSRRILDE